MTPKYTGVWDRGGMWRGDTLLGFSMRIADKDTGAAVVPTEVCAHIVDTIVEREYIRSFAIMQTDITERNAVAEYSSGVYYFAAFTGDNHVVIAVTKR